MRRKKLICVCKVFVLRRSFLIIKLNFVWYFCDIAPNLLLISCRIENSLLMRPWFMVISFPFKCMSVIYRFRAGGVRVAIDNGIYWSVFNLDRCWARNVCFWFWKYLSNIGGHLHFHENTRLVMQQRGGSETRGAPGFHAWHCSKTDQSFFVCEGTAAGQQNLEFATIQKCRWDQFRLGRDHFPCNYMTAFAVRNWRWLVKGPKDKKHLNLWILTAE